MSAGHAIVGAYTVPEPDRDSGSKRIVDHVDLLLESGWQVTFLATQPLREDRHLRALRQRGVGVFHATPERLATIVSAAPVDVALLAFWPTGEYLLPLIRHLSPDTRVIVDSVDLHLLRHARRVFAATSGPRTLDDRFGDQVIGELNVYAASDAVLTVSAKEAALIDDLVNEPGLARVVPDHEELPLSGPPFEARRGLLFVGSFRHAPNVDAVGHLCREIVPRLPEGLLEEHPVSIVGDALDDRVSAFGLGRRTIRMVGWVPRLEPYFEQARVCVLPLLSGAGTKRKMVQSLMLGTPVVGSTIACEGLDLEDGRDVLVADGPDAFAEAVVRLVGDEALWDTLRRNGRRRALASHGRDVSRRALLGTIADVLAMPPREPLLAVTDDEHHLQRLRYQWEMSLIDSGGRRSRRSTPPATGGQGSGATRGPGAEDEAAPVGSGNGRRPAGHRVASSAVAYGRATAAHPDPGDGDADDADDAEVRLIAFYLPQFHPIPENDAWWGEGFTEWTNVRRATPLFEGHAQPVAPGELGAYDLRDPETRWRQAQLAREHGIDAFSYYRYWFHGKRLLERPFDEVLASGEPDLPFALCWANEPWSRRWDGSEDLILQPQHYSREDDLAHIRALLPALADERAVRVGGRPLLIVYQGHALPAPEATTDIWRSEVDRVGLPGLHLLCVETGWDEGWDATRVGFDGKVRFQPQFNVLRATPQVPTPGRPRLRVFDYERAWPTLDALPEAGYPTCETVFPHWDNTPRRGDEGYVIHGSTPEAYERWLTTAVARAAARPPDQRLVFINAWNEWAEGAYLEPDERHGRAYLEATRRARRLATPA
jgi:glycosyltransferase involved in cell wall biosynthesis